MKIFLILSLLFLLPLTVHSQRTASDEVTGGSVYSVIGFGFPRDIKSPNTEGMGLLGVSVHDRFSASLANPALWGKSNFTQGSVSIGLSRFNAKDNFDTSSTNTFDFENFQFVFPIQKQKIGASISFTPITRSRFELETTTQIVATPGREPLSASVTNGGTGGVNRAEAGIGFTINENLSVGYAASVYFTSLDNNVRSIVNSAQFLPVQFTESLNGTGFGNRFGIFSRFDNVLSDRDFVSFGATVSLPVSYSAIRSVDSFVNVDGTDQLIDLLSENDLKRADIKFPLEINGGVTYNTSPLLNLTSEVLYQRWSDAEFEFSSREEQYFNDRIKIGVGAQFHPYISSQRRGFFSGFRYSVGASYDTGHLKIDNDNIDTIMVNAGIGIITRGDASTVDLNFHYGIRGTQSGNLVKENIWGLKLSLNLAEIMFLQPKFQ